MLSLTFKARVELALFSRDPVSLLRAALPSLRNPVSDVEIGQQGRLEAFLSHLRLHPSRRWLWRALPHVQVSNDLRGNSGAFTEQLWAHLKDSPARPARALKPSCMALRVRETVESFVLPRLQTISIAGSSTSRDLTGLLSFHDVGPGNGTQESRVLCVRLLCHTHLIFFL